MCKPDFFSCSFEESHRFKSEETDDGRIGGAGAAEGAELVEWCLRILSKPRIIMFCRLFR